MFKIVYTISDETLSQKFIVSRLLNCPKIHLPHCQYFSKHPFFSRLKTFFQKEFNNVENNICLKILNRLSRFIQKQQKLHFLPVTWQTKRGYLVWNIL